MIETTSQLYLHRRTIATRARRGLWTIDPFYVLDMRQRLRHSDIEYCACVGQKRPGLVILKSERMSIRVDSRH